MSLAWLMRWSVALWLAGAFVFGGMGRARAQPPERSIGAQDQLWLGYLTQVRVSEPLSIWNDFHYVRGAFYVLRTGLTHHLSDKVALTAGYAHLGLPVGTVNRELQRREHRPWAQLVTSSPLGASWSLVNRVRYEMRFRHNVADDRLAPGYDLTHRLRFLVTFRRDLNELRFGEHVPFVSVGNEVLVNFGENVVYNHFDQNRVTVGAGLARRRFALQVGYMNRFVQLPSGRDFVMNHTLVVWIFHNFDLRQRPSGAD